MAKGDYKIPFDDEGNQLDYESFRRNPSTGAYEPVGSKDNFEFTDTLTFQGYDRGRSSVTFQMKRFSTNTTVSMFISDFSEIVNKMNHGAITGTFTFVKKGQNYGCKMVSP